MTTTDEPPARPAKRVGPPPIGGWCPTSVECAECDRRSALWDSGNRPARTVYGALEPGVDLPEDHPYWTTRNGRSDAALWADYHRALADCLRATVRSAAETGQPVDLFVPAGRGSNGTGAETRQRPPGASTAASGRASLPLTPIPEPDAP